MACIFFLMASIVLMLVAFFDAIFKPFMLDFSNNPQKRKEKQWRMMLKKDWTLSLNGHTALTAGRGKMADKAGSCKVISSAVRSRAASGTPLLGSQLYVYKVENRVE